jgi:signal peptidase I
VPENKVIGRAFVVIWPPSDVAGLPIPATFQRAALDVSSAATSPAGLGAATALPVAWLAWARRRRRRLGARR